MNMELQELKDLWRQHDQKLDQQIQLNTRLLKNMELNNTRSALRQTTFDPIFGIVFGALMIVPLGSFIFNHIAQLKYAGPACALVLYALLLIIDSVYRLTSIKKIDYDGPVAQIQQHLEKLRIHNMRYTLILNGSWAVLWFFVPIVALKGLANFDFYTPHQGWILWNLAICSAIGLAITAFGIWLARRFSADQITRPWLKNLADTLAGRNLARAKASLREIEDFTREN